MNFRIQITSEFHIIFSLEHTHSSPKAPSIGRTTHRVYSFVLRDRYGWHNCTISQIDPQWKRNAKENSCVAGFTSSILMTLKAPSTFTRDAFISIAQCVWPARVQWDLNHIRLSFETTFWTLALRNCQRQKSVTVVISRINFMQHSSRSSMPRSPTDRPNARVNFQMFGLFISDKWLWMMNEHRPRLLSRHLSSDDEPLGLNLSTITRRTDDVTPLDKLFLDQSPVGYSTFIPTDSKFQFLFQNSFLFLSCHFTNNLVWYLIAFKK